MLQIPCFACGAELLRYEHQTAVSRFWFTRCPNANEHSQTIDNCVACGEVLSIGRTSCPNPNCPVALKPNFSQIFGP
jgi:ribosomal protein S27E